MKTFIITGEFEYEIDAETKEEAVEKVQDNLADLNNICHEVQEVKYDPVDIAAKLEKDTYNPVDIAGVGVSDPYPKIDFEKIDALLKWVREDLENDIDLYATYAKKLEELTGPELSWFNKKL